MVKNSEDMFIHFDRIHHHDGRTDRQTPHGKNLQYAFCKNISSFTCRYFDNNYYYDIVCTNNPSNPL